MSGLDWYRRASVRNKILLGFGLVMLFVLLAVALVVVQTLQIDRLADEFEQGEAVLNEVQDVEIALADRAAAFFTYLLTGEETARAGLESAEEQLDVELREARVLGVQREGLQPLDSVARLAERFRTQVVEPGLQLRRRVTAGELTLDQAFATLPADLGRDITVQERELLERIVDEQTVLTASERGDLSQANGRIRGFTILMTLLAAAVGVAVALWISSAVSTPLTRAVEFAGAVAAGDLTQRLPIERDDEFGTLSGTLNRMAEDLRRMVGEVNTATVQVASAAEQIAATSKHISETVDAQVGSTEDTSSSMEEIASQIARVAQSTESLASSVDQTSSSVAEMGESIEQTARNADRLGVAVEQTSVTIEEMVASITQVGRNVEETGRIVEGAEADATKGGEAVARSSEGMRRVHTEMSDLAGVVRELGDTGESIGRISEVIEDIADQTNLLALNAAIEAARAGEHGRGFAVVAHEIRRLAERSVEAAREIGATIGGVREEVDRVVRSAGRVLGRTEEGLGLADAAGSALEQITASAGRTRDLMAEVHTATRQQIGAATQVQEAIRQMQEVAEDARTATREQAEGARQIVRAVEDMNLQTQEVFAATAEQKRGGELVVRATDDISRGAREAQGAVKELVGAAEDLSAQASRLTELVDRFRV